MALAAAPSGSACSRACAPTNTQLDHPNGCHAERTQGGCLCNPTWELDGIGKEYEDRCANPASPTREMLNGCRAARFAASSACLRRANAWQPACTNSHSAIGQQS